MINYHHNLSLEEIVKYPNREEAYYILVALFIKGPEQIREQIRKDWDYGVEWIYPNQRRLACRKNEKQSVIDRIHVSLVYHAIENFKFEDIRDKLMSIAAIYHSCIQAGLDPHEEFENVAIISSPKMAKFLRDFISRKIEDKSKDAFMLTTKKNIDGETEILLPGMK